MQTNLLFELEFAKAYPSFTSNLSKAAPNLTSREIKISMYLRLSYESKQIQNQLVFRFRLSATVFLHNSFHKTPLVG